MAKALLPSRPEQGMQYTSHSAQQPAVQPQTGTLITQPVQHMQYTQPPAAQPQYSPQQHAQQQSSTAITQCSAGHKIIPAHAQLHVKTHSLRLASSDICNVMHAADTRVCCIGSPCAGASAGRLSLRCSSSHRFQSTDSRDEDIDIPQPSSRATRQQSADVRHAYDVWQTINASLLCALPSLTQPCQLCSFHFIWPSEQSLLCTRLTRLSSLVGCIGTCTELHHFYLPSA